MSNNKNNDIVPLLLAVGLGTAGVLLYNNMNDNEKKLSESFKTYERFEEQKKSEEDQLQENVDKINQSDSKNKKDLILKEVQDFLEKVKNVPLSLKRKRIVKTVLKDIDMYMDPLTREIKMIPTMEVKGPSSDVEVDDMDNISFVVDEKREKKVLDDLQDLENRLKGDELKQAVLTRIRTFLKTQKVYSDDVKTRFQELLAPLGKLIDPLTQTIKNVSTDEVKMTFGTRKRASAPVKMLRSVQISEDKEKLLFADIEKIKQKTAGSNVNQQILAKIKEFLSTQSALTYSTENKLRKLLRPMRKTIDPLTKELIDMRSSSMIAPKSVGQSSSDSKGVTFVSSGEGDKEKINLANTHFASLDSSRRKYYTHARKDDGDDLLLMNQLRGGKQARVFASDEGTSSTTPAALRRVMNKLQKVPESKPSDLVGYNLHYKLPDKYYYEPRGTSLFEQVTKKNKSNMVEVLEKNRTKNRYSMGTTYRVYEEINKQNNM